MRVPPSSRFVLTYEFPKTWRFASGESIPTPIFPVTVSTTAFDVLPTPLNVILSTSVKTSCPLVDISIMCREYFLAKWDSVRFGGNYLSNVKTRKMKSTTVSYITMFN